MSAGQEPQSPKPLALVVCDSITADSGNGKFHLLGTFETISATTFPTNVRMGVYFAVVDCRGKHRLQLKLVYAGEGLDDEEIMSADIDFEEPDPIKAVQFGIEIGSPIPNPGVYYLQLHSALDGCLIERRLVAFQLPQPEEPKQ